MTYIVNDNSDNCKYTDVVPMVCPVDCFMSMRIRLLSILMNALIGGGLRMLHRVCLDLSQRQKNGLDFVREIW